MKPQHLALGLLISLVWGFNFVAGKVALDHFPPFAMLLFRFVIVLVLLFPFLRVPRDRIRPLLGVAVTLGVFHFSLNFSGLYLSGDVSSAAIASQLFIPFATILAVLVLGEQVGWRRTLAIAVAFAGTVVIGFDPVVVDHLDALLVVVVSTVPMAVATILMRRLEGVRPLQVQAWTGLVAVPTYLALTLLFEDGQVAALRSAPWQPVTAIVYSAIGASVVAHSTLYYLLQRYPVTWVNPLLLLAPVFAVIFGITVYGDTPTPQIVIGGAMTILGVAVVAVRSATRSEVAIEKAPAP